MMIQLNNSQFLVKKHPNHARTALLPLSSPCFWIHPLFLCLPKKKRFTTFYALLLALSQRLSQSPFELCNQPSPFASLTPKKIPAYASFLLDHSSSFFLSLLFAFLLPASLPLLLDVVGSRFFMPFRTLFCKKQAVL